MMRRMAIPFLLLSLLTGCWDAKEVQSMNFITMMGIDYVKDNYVIYGQMVDFTTISKQEGPPKPANAKKWIGKGTGSSLKLAMNDLYNASQQQTMWTHIVAVLFSENVMNSHLEEVLNGLVRSADTRYTPWAYGTKEDMASILSSNSLLNQVISNMELYEPQELYKQKSIVKPIVMLQLMDGVKEPATNVLMPSVTTTKQTWAENKQPISLPQFDGAYLIYNGKSLSHLDLDHLKAVRYIRFHPMNRYPMSQIMGNGQRVSLYLRKPQTKFILKADENKIAYDLKLTMHATINELSSSSSLDLKELKRRTEESIRDDIRESFAWAKERNMDVFGLEEKLYRYDNRLWKKMKQEQQSDQAPIARLSLNSVEVKVKFDSSDLYRVQLR